MDDAKFSYWRNTGRIPTLDGLRAIAICFVLAAHALGTGILPMHDRLSVLAGDIGVRLFFVLSGFLITTLLMREHARHGAISLPQFFLRRACRIFPAFYAYLLVAGLLAAVGVFAMCEGDLVAAATYTTNFHAERSWVMGHLWSLAVEEQFYVVWPVVLVTAGLLRSWRFAVLAVLAAPVFRVVLWHWFPEHRDLADQAFPCVFDALATGCLLALAMPRLVRSPLCARLLASRWFYVAVALALAALAIRQPTVRHGLAMSVANIALAAIILRCVVRPHDHVARLLERPTFVWIGTLSYSLYLWQQLFLNRHSEAWIHQFPVNVVFALGAAVVCHHAIERPFLRLNTRWRPSEQPRPAPSLSVLTPAPVVLDVSRVRARTTMNLPLVLSGSFTHATREPGD